MLIAPFNIFSVNRFDVAQLPDTIPLSEPVPPHSFVLTDSVTLIADSIALTPVDSISIVDSPQMALFADSTLAAGAPEGAIKVFTPDPVRAVWMSALFPGLGQIYNRRYWKLPIVIGGFMGLGYGASWNNDMLSDYSRAYHDFMDKDPNTNSYMDFFPPNTDESMLNQQWLQRILKSRKDYFRRNRDLCIIGMVGVYLLAMVDAYVDASLSNFDIAPDLSMQVQPAVIGDFQSNLPAIGVQLAINF